jgi:hypothetical protein
MTLRIALIDDQTGEFTVNGQRCKAVPVEPSLKYIETIRQKNWDDDGFCLSKEDYHAAHAAMLSAAAIDLSGLPVVPPRSPDVASDLNYWLDEIGVPK